MEENNRGPGRSSVSPGVVLWMLILGGYAVMTGIAAIPQWSSYSTWTQLYYAISLGAGTCLAILGLMQAGFHVRARSLPIFEVGVLVLLTVNQGAGLLRDTILCYTPG